MSASIITSDVARGRRLDGKAALVTGGASGIGEAIARRFRQHGAKVCIVDIQDDLGGEVCEKLGGAPDVRYFHCDVTVEEEVRQAVDFVLREFGALDVMVNNAGSVGPVTSDIRDVDLADLQAIFDVNVKGVFAGMKHAARAMIPRRKGSIVSLGSVASVMGALGPHAYTASKHAVVGLTRGVAAELGTYGIRVNCVSPHAVPTPMALSHLRPEADADVVQVFTSFVGRSANLIGATLKTDDVAEAVVYLASDEAGYVSGLNLMVDGGFTCVNHSLGVFRSMRESPLHG